MASFTQQTYTPKYIPTLHSPIVSVTIKPPQHRQKTSYIPNKLKQDFLPIPQSTSQIKSPSKRSKQLDKKPRISAFQFYKSSSKNLDNEESYENADTPKIPTRKPFPISDHKDTSTKYFTNSALTKKANSEREAGRSLSKSKSKINKSIKDKLVITEMRAGEKPIMFEKMRKGSTNYPEKERTEVYGQFYQLDHPNLNRFKSPLTSVLRNQFLKIMGETESCDSELYDRKTEKSVKSKKERERQKDKEREREIQKEKERDRFKEREGDKIIMTKKQLEIMNLNHKLSQLQKLHSQQKLAWSQKQKSLTSSLITLQNQVQSLKIQKSSSQLTLTSKYNKLQTDYNSKRRLIKQLTFDNKLLISTLINTQSIMNKMRQQHFKDIQSRVDEFNHMRHTFIALHEKSRNLHNGNSGDFSNHFLNRNWKHKIEGKDGEIEEMKREIGVKEEYIKMLHMKVDTLGSQLRGLKGVSEKLGTTEMLLAEMNKNVMMNCVAKLNMDMEADDFDDDEEYEEEDGNENNQE